MIYLRYHLIRGSQTTYTVGHLNWNRGSEISPRQFVPQKYNSTCCPRHQSPCETALGLLLSALPSVLLSTEQRHGLIQTWTAHPVVDWGSSNGIRRGSCCVGTAEQQVPRSWHNIGSLGWFLSKTPRYLSAMPAVRVGGKGNSMCHSFLLQHFALVFITRLFC